MAVGRLKPVARTSFWKKLVLATFTVTGAESVAVAGGVAGPRRQRVRAVRRRARVPGEPVRGRGVLGAGRDAVDEELDACDADVVARVGRHVHDVAHLRAGRGRGDRDGRRGRVAGLAAAHARRHVGLDLRGCERPVVDADVVDAPVELSTRRSARRPMSTSSAESCWAERDRADLRTVVELAVEVDVHRRRSRVVDAGDVVPGVRLQRGRAVADHVGARAVRRA